MASIKRSDTKSEAALRSTLHANGLRFRKNYPIRLDRRSVRFDSVFARGSVKAFVDGCHRHVCLEQRRRRRSSVEFCDHKLGTNQERDRLQTSPLRKRDGQLVHSGSVRSLSRQRQRSSARLFQQAKHYRTSANSANTHRPKLVSAPLRDPQGTSSTLTVP